MGRGPERLTFRPESDPMTFRTREHDEDDEIPDEEHVFALAGAWSRDPTGFDEPPATGGWMAFGADGVG